MGKEQGDHVPDNPDVYVKTVDGEEQERTAYSPADAVQMRAQGWVRKTGKPAGKRAPAAARATEAAAASTQDKTA